MAPGVNNDELAECRRDPPPPFQSDDKLFREWMQRHRDYFISLEHMQLHQLPNLSTLWGYDEEYFRTEILRKLAHVTRVAGRRLTSHEIALYLDNAMKETVIQSYDRPAAITITLLLISMGWTNYTLPFYKPPSAHFHLRIPPPLSRPLIRWCIATASGRGARCGLYIGFGLLAYKVLSPVYRILVASSLGFLETEQGQRTAVIEVGICSIISLFRYTESS
jgi:hypothetical protein